MQWAPQQICQDTSVNLQCEQLQILQNAHRWNVANLKIPDTPF